MNIIDISWPLTRGMTTYKNRDDFCTEDTKKWDTHRARESRLMLASHVGTHVDAPAHFLEQGAGIDTISLTHLCGPCTVLDLTAVPDAIIREDLTNLSFLTSRVLLKTRNSFHQATAPFDSNFVYLAASGAAYLRECGVCCVGIDYLGIERGQPAHDTHTILLSADCAIIEGLRLAQVDPGEYTLFCLPLAVSGLEAAPARAVLLPG